MADRAVFENEYLLRHICSFHRVTRAHPLRAVSTWFHQHAQNVMTFTEWSHDNKPLIQWLIVRNQEEWQQFRLLTNHNYESLTSLSILVPISPADLKDLYLDVLDLDITLSCGSDGGGSVGSGGSVGGGLCRNVNWMTNFRLLHVRVAPRDLNNNNKPCTLVFIRAGVRLHSEFRFDPCSTPLSLLHVQELSLPRMDNEMFNLLPPSLKFIKVREWVVTPLSDLAELNYLNKPTFVQTLQTDIVDHSHWLPPTLEHLSIDTFFVPDTGLHPRSNLMQLTKLKTLLINHLHSYHLETISLADLPRGLTWLAIGTPVRLNTNGCPSQMERLSIHTHLVDRSEFKALPATLTHLELFWDELLKPNFTIFPVLQYLRFLHHSLKSDFSLQGLKIPSQTNVVVRSSTRNYSITKPFIHDVFSKTFKDDPFILE